MNVIIQINGREAIPVRAIPLLTHWRFMSPDIVAHVLGGTAGNNVGLFGDLQAYRMEEGEVQPMRQDTWANESLMELNALSKRIKESEPIDEIGYSKWRKKSLKKLPAGAFVWKEDYQRLHDRNWNSRFQMNYCALRDWNGEEPDYEVDSQLQCDLSRDLRRDDLVDDNPLKRQLRESLEVLKRWREPDYCPFMDDDLQKVVLKGFEKLLPDSNQMATVGTTPAQTATPALVVVGGDAKPWLLIDPQDPTPKQQWYTPARYFARQLVVEKPTLLANRGLLAEKVSTALFNAGFKKRGGKFKFDSGTVLKAFANVTIG
ncbi:MAG: hypothetical protein IPN53_26320 [Comamonadaceae bacterium]|nr:hypothetical protein [Comamonadaceae bacterium]